ncbi:hypothetical protein SAMN05444149_105436 [Pseudosulfitobacter pseudonitzschiae]|uniref:hypothetical protein n=1 Tax=Pseudosulfitobacter pseudonitzschiae TaxID=1402135 RepID=UPI000915CF40|nr:hypothetical protein [Pseudosulfitobacter pseudonitzschiae]QKS08572.1 hypothetical protein HT745_08845 [Pseudosulfitobacter pseudonitzschiae]SHF78873.1 hypothetical protein SAMN05444149_105436 [Pseudosulfitobacter pseudonitzschiae]
MGASLTSLGKLGPPEASGTFLAVEELDRMTLAGLEIDLLGDLQLRDSRAGGITEAKA